MKISDGKTVSIEYSMSLENGEMVESNEGEAPLIFVQGQHQLFKAIESSLYGLAADESKKIVLKPEEAYGPVNPEAIVTAPIEHLPEDTRKIGALVQTDNPQGQAIKGQVIKVDTDEATIDFNHPLAGKTLNFNIKIISVEGD